MKIHGQKIPSVNEEIVVIPRGEDRIIFRARMVRDFDSFDALCPRPVPPTRLYPDGRKVADVEDQTYRAALDKYITQKNAWLFLTSLDATPGLEWETVDKSNCDTWTNYYKELEDNSFSDVEINIIMEAVINANSLSRQRVEDATKSFLQEQRSQKA
jgi:hypothetical protein